MYTYRFSREPSQTVTQRCSVCRALIPPSAAWWWCVAHAEEAQQQWPPINRRMGRVLSRRAGTLTVAAYDQLFQQILDTLLDEKR